MVYAQKANPDEPLPDLNKKIGDRSSKGSGCPPGYRCT